MKFSEIKVDFIKQPIKSITILNDSLKYNWTLQIMNNDHFDNFPFSYLDSVDLDFKMISTRFVKNDTVYFAVHFNLQKGVELGFCSDTFLIPKCSEFYLNTLNGNKIESYSFENKRRFYKGIKSYFFLKKFEPRQNVVMILSFPHNKEKENFKIHINTIVVTIADFKRNLKAAEVN